MGDNLSTFIVKLTTLKGIVYYVLEPNLKYEEFHIQASTKNYNIRKVQKQHKNSFFFLNYYTHLKPTFTHFNPSLFLLLKYFDYSTFVLV